MNKSISLEDVRKKHTDITDKLLLKLPHGYNTEKGLIRSIISRSSQSVFESAWYMYYVAKNFGSFVQWFNKTFKNSRKIVPRINTCIAKTICGKTLGEIVNPILDGRTNKNEKAEGMS